MRQEDRGKMAATRPLTAATDTLSIHVSHAVVTHQV